MKKVLIGVGIGCGVLVLLGVIAMVAGGMWVKNRAGDFVAGFEGLEAQEKASEALNARFPFTPPADGETHALTADRLDRWVRVLEQSREEAQTFKAVFEEGSAVGDSLDGKGAAEAFSEIGARTKMVLEATQVARGQLLEKLEAVEMSPAEFWTISMTVLGTQTTDQLERMEAGVNSMREQVAKGRKEMEERIADPSTTEEERAALKASIDATETAMADMPAAMAGVAANEVQKANAALVTPIHAKVKDLNETAALLMSLAGGRSPMGQGE